MSLNRRQFLASAASAPLLSAAPPETGPAEYPLYIGTYTNGSSK